MAKNEELFNAICKGQRKLVEEIVNKAVAGGASVVEMLNDSMIPAMRSMGDKFSRNEVYVPEMLIAARAMAAGLKIIEPILVSAGHKPLAKVCIGTVKGDLHDIGKNLVKMMFDVGGFTVHDLGRDVPLENFVEEQLRTDSEIVAMSAMMTTTMLGMKKVIQMIKDKNPNVAIMLGGAPITKDVVSLFGADGYAESAGNAVTEGIKMIGRLRELQKKK